MPLDAALKGKMFRLRLDMSSLPVSREGPQVYNRLVPFFSQEHPNGSRTLGVARPLDGRLVPVVWCRQHEPFTGRSTLCWRFRDETGG